LPRMQLRRQAAYLAKAIWLSNVDSLLTPPVLTMHP